MDVRCTWQSTDDRRYVKRARSMPTKYKYHYQCSSKWYTEPLWYGYWIRPKADQHWPQRVITMVSHQLISEQKLITWGLNERVTRCPTREKPLQEMFTKCHTEKSQKHGQIAYQMMQNHEPESVRNLLMETKTEKSAVKTTKNLTVTNFQVNNDSLNHPPE